MILKTKKTTTVEKRALVPAQQNSYDAGDESLPFFGFFESFE
jgi:hypothetical protein